jgi:hypothetical protein
MVKLLVDEKTLTVLKTNTFDYIENTYLKYLLLKHNVEIINYDIPIDKSTYYDFFVTMSWNFVNNTIIFENNYLNKNVIFLMRKDSSNMYGSVLVKHPKIILILTDYTNDIWMMPNLNDRIQYFLCYPLEKKISHNNLNIYSLSKIKNCHWNIAQYSCCGNQFLNHRSENNNQLVKSIDVACCFHMRHGQDDGKHRMELYDKLDTLKTKYIISNNYDISGVEYDKLVKKSKIFVSPYGMGERTASDYFAIYNDCILIKPFSKYINCDCDFFDKDYYINCKVDFSDLDMIIEDVLLHYDKFFEKTQKAKTHLLTITPEKHISKFFDIITNYDIIEKNYNHCFPYIMNEEYTIDMIYYTNLSNIMFDLNDLEYIFYNDNDTANELLNILNNTQSGNILCIPNIYFNIESLNHNCYIENDNKKIFYEKYQAKYLITKNLFYNYDKIHYFSSFITKPHYYDQLFNIEYFRKISNLFYDKKVLVVTCFSTFFDSLLLKKCNMKTLFEITKNFYETDYNDIVDNIYDKVNNNNYDIVLVMLEKMSPLISSKIATKIKVIDMGKTFGVLSHYLKLFPDNIL